MSVVSEKSPPEFRREVEELSGTLVSRCFQCRKCSNGCPLYFAMDILPDRIIRMVNLNRKDEALESRTIWTCASCLTCSTRCPNEIDIARVMDTLRSLAYKAGKVAEPNIPLFNEVFLDSVKRHGRVFEAGMIQNYTLKRGEIWKRLKAGELWDEAKLGMSMYFKGKIHLWPRNVKKIKDVRELFTAVEET